MSMRASSHLLRRQALRACALATACAIAIGSPAASIAQTATARNRAPVTLNFVNAEIEGVARAMAAILDRQVLVDPRVKGQITLYSEQPMSPNEAYLNFLAALRGQGFAVVEVGGLLKVVPEADAKLQTGTVSVGAPTRTGDQILTQIFRLQHENANNMVTVLRPLISPNNTINANPNNNSLVITDYADNLQRLAKIIAAMDTAGATDVDVIPLQHAVAADLAATVQRLAEGGPTGVSVPGAPPTASGAVSVVADSRTNSLLVRAPTAAKLATVRALVDKLDRPGMGGAGGSNIYVVYLKNADAVRMAQVLRAAFASGASTGGPGGAAGGGGGATGGQSPLSQANLGNLGGNANTGMSAQAAAPVSQTQAPSTGGFIQADPATNALIITAPEPMYRQLRAVIEQLDARRAQVYVETMLIEVNATKAADLGFQWQGLIGKQGDSTGIIGGTNFGTGGNNLLNLSIAAATGDATVLPAAGLNIGLIKRYGGVYTLGALARFLETNADGNILSTPNLVTLDNEEAKIVVGQNVPFVTGSFSNTGGTGAINPFQTIERKDVGITLRVKPQIGENGTVRMTIYQEASSVVNQNVSKGVADATAGLVTNKRSIESAVVVEDGDILVLGGLMQDQFQNNRDQVPGLGNVPVLGGLFRSENRTRTKNNLMVFIRPVVMRGPEQANQLSLDRYDVIRAMQKDAQPEPRMLLPVNEGPLVPPMRAPQPRPSEVMPAMPPSEPASAPN